MKTLLVTFLVGTCALAMHSTEIMDIFGMADSEQAPAISVDASVDAQTAAPEQKPMTAEEFAASLQTDRSVYQKFIDSYRETGSQFGEVEKKIGLLARGISE